MMQYILQPTQNDILHYGVDHLHSKNGRGSGRYPWGSGKQPGNKKKVGKYVSYRDAKKYEQDKKKISGTEISETVKKDLITRWNSKKESFDDYNERRINAYKEYSKSFSDQTKDAEKELDNIISDITPNDGSDTRKYAGIAALVNDDNDLGRVASKIWSYKYDDGDQAGDSSAMIQLVSKYGYDNAKNKLNQYFKAINNLEKSMANDFDSDTAHELIDARCTADDVKSRYSTYNLRDGVISGSKSDYDNAIKKANLLNDSVTFNYNIENIANNVANKIKADRDSGMSDKDISDKYAISNEFIEDVFRRSTISHGIKAGIYVLKPTNSDIMHSAKGTTWKNHKYVDIVTKNGKRVYKYGRYLTNRAKSKITGRNAVTNADAKKSIYSGKKYTQYNPSIATVYPYRDQGMTSIVEDGTRVYADFYGYPHKTTNYTEKAVTKALLENMTANSYSRGLKTYGYVMKSHRELSSIPITNANGTPYSPTQSTKAANEKRRRKE